MTAIWNINLVQFGSPIGHHVYVRQDTWDASCKLIKKHAQKRKRDRNSKEVSFFDDLYFPLE